MYSESYQGINELLVSLSRILLKEGRPRITRGKKCYELPAPILIKLDNPSSRIITLPERKWPVHMGYAESLWLSTGRNDVDFMSAYLPRMREFSDDGKFVRAGYGPRIKTYNSSEKDYERNTAVQNNDTHVGIDQLKYVVDCLLHEKTSRRAVIELGDPIKDNYVNSKLKETKDYPCTRSLQFIVNNDNRLDLYVHMRSNDFIWGMTGVNIFNYTFMQEYVSQILGVPLGSYYHIANNLHFYEEYKDKLTRISESSYSDEFFEYNSDISSYDDFESKIRCLCNWESKIRTGQNIGLIDLESDFMNDWQRVIYDYLTGSRSRYINNILNRVR
ncbi:thymidylate synthase [Vibrio splendidus]